MMAPSRVLARMKKEGVKNLFQGIKIMWSGNFCNLKIDTDDLVLDGC